MSRMTRLVLLTLTTIPLVAASLVGAPAAASATGGATQPQGFAAQSITWISPLQGWMLGSGQCGAGTCTEVVVTSNGGARWRFRGRVKAPLNEEGHHGVSEIRFANRRIGWAFGPSLHATNDGGSTWVPQTIPGGGRRVLALATDATVAYLVESACRLSKPISRCHQPSVLWRSEPPGAGWSRVPLDLPVSIQAILALHGRVAYVVIPSLSADPDTFDATVDGNQWETRPVPCSKTRDETLFRVAPISDSRVALMCIGDPGIGKSVKRVFRSRDTALTTRSAGTAPLLGITSELAATPNGTLALSSFSSGGWIYRNEHGRAWTTGADEADQGVGWNDIDFTTNMIGFVIHGPEALFGPGQLWGTVDGGATWAPLPAVRPAG